jgi:hypothetical protein
MKKSFLFPFLLPLLTLYQDNILLAQNGQALPCDSIAVTCEAYSSADPVLAIMKLNGLGVAPINANFGPPATTARHQAGTTQFSRANLGQVFGLAYTSW